MTDFNATIGLTFFAVIPACPPIKDFGGRLKRESGDPGLRYAGAGFASYGR